MVPEVGWSEWCRWAEKWSGGPASFWQKLAGGRTRPCLWIPSSSQEPFKGFLLWPVYTPCIIWPQFTSHDNIIPTQLYWEWAAFLSFPPLPSASTSNQPGPPTLLRMLLCAFGPVPSLSPPGTLPSISLGLKEEVLLGAPLASTWHSPHSHWHIVLFLTVTLYVCNGVCVCTRSHLPCLEVRRKACLAVSSHAVGYGSKVLSKYLLDKSTTGYMYEWTSTWRGLSWTRCSHFPRPIPDVFHWESHPGAQTAIQSMSSVKHKSSL